MVAASPRRLAWALRVALLVALLMRLQATSAVAEPPPAPTANPELGKLLVQAKAFHPIQRKREVAQAKQTAQQRQLRRMYLPQLSLSGQASIQSDVTAIDLGIDLPSITLPELSPKHYRVTVDAQQLIWNGGATSAQLKIARAAGTAEKLKADADWYQVSDRIAQLYFAAMQAQQEIRQYGSFLKYLALQAEKVGSAFAGGVVSEKDVLLLQAKLAEIEQEMVDATLRLDGVCQAIALMTGVAIDPSGELGFAVPDDLLDIAPTQGIARPDVDLLAQQKTLLSAQAAAARAKDNPQIALFGQAGYGYPGLNALSEDADFFWIAGIQIKIPLTYLYAGTRGLEARGWRMQREDVEIQRASLLLQLQAQAAMHTQDILRLRKAIETDGRQIALRARIRENTEIRFEKGTASMTDLLEDISREEQAKLQQTAHQIALQAKAYELLYVLGRPHA